jgi:hypothetical protein
MSMAVMMVDVMVVVMMMVMVVVMMAEEAEEFMIGSLWDAGGLVGFLLVDGGLVSLSINCGFMGGGVDCGLVGSLLSSDSCLMGRSDLSGGRITSRVLELTSSARRRSKAKMVLI